MQSKTTAKDFFLYLGVIIGLYVSSVSFLMLSFAIIEKVFPLAGEFLGGQDGTIRTAVAILIIFFPAFLYLTKVINKELKASPEKKEIWIRKWLIYLTLFITGLAIAIDLVTLIERFLSAEDMTLRFFLKVILVLLVSASVFKYYFYELKRNFTEARNNAKIFAYVSSFFVLLAIGYGIFLVGSPAMQREVNLDQQRVTDLSNIQYQIVNVQWTNKGTVPANLTELNDQISGFTVPTDPETSQPYEYKMLSKNSFELCAAFKTSEQLNQNMTYSYPQGLNNNWVHNAERTCFDRTIDPSIYPVQPKPIPVK